jgi:hypothetical protein
MVVAVSALSGCGGQSRPPSASTTDTVWDRVGSAVAAAPTTTTPVVSPEDLDPATYEAITPREFALLVKNPDASIGRKVVLYGLVTQFDTGTGQDSFRARTGAEIGDYRQNSIFYAKDPSILSQVVARDAVTIWCKGNGTETYKTTHNGVETVPKFWVNIIKDAGSTSPNQNGAGR